MKSKEILPEKDRYKWNGTQTNPDYAGEKYFIELPDEIQLEIAYELHEALNAAENEILKLNAYKNEAKERYEKALISFNTFSTIEQALKIATGLTEEK